MQPLFHSPFLQALGYAIASSLWQMAVIWMVFSCIQLITRPGAVFKYRLAVIAQASGLAWFLLTLQFYYSKYHDAFQASALLGPAGNISWWMPASSGSFSSLLLNWMLQAERFFPFLSIAYLLLLAFMCARWISQYRHSNHIRNKGRWPVEERWENFMKHFAERLGITKNIGLYLSEMVGSPLTAGFLKPVILLPFASINYLSTEQMEAVLIHELAHIRRYDYLWNLLISIGETAMFFNPFSQLISRDIRRERENCCDDWVLRSGYDASMYAGALLRIAQASHAHHQKKPLPSFAMAAAKNGALLSRVRRMIVQDRRFGYRNQLFSLLMITILLSSVAWLRPSATIGTTATPSTKKTHRLVIEPMAAKIDNPLFNPAFFIRQPLRKEMEKNMEEAQMDKNDRKEEMANLPQDIFESSAKAIAGPGVKAVVEQDIETAAKTISTLNFPHIYTDTGTVRIALPHLMNVDFARQLREARQGFTRVKKDWSNTWKNQDWKAFGDDAWKSGANEILRELAGMDFNNLGTQINLLSKEVQKKMQDVEKQHTAAEKLHSLQQKLLQLNTDNDITVSRYHLPLQEDSPGSIASNDENGTDHDASMFIPALFTTGPSAPAAPRSPYQDNKIQARTVSNVSVSSSPRITKRIEICVSRKNSKNIDIVVEIY